MIFGKIIKLNLGFISFRKIFSLITPKGYFPILYELLHVKNKGASSYFLNLQSKLNSLVGNLN